MKVDGSGKWVNVGAGVWRTGPLYNLSAPGIGTYWPGNIGPYLETVAFSKTIVQDADM